MASPHPLVTLRFAQSIPDPNPDGFTGLTYERYWYHVPRVGDYVDFSGPEHLEPLLCRVTAVVWTNDGRDAAVVIDPEPRVVEA